MAVAADDPRIVHSLPGRVRIHTPALDVDRAASKAIDMIGDFEMLDVRASEMGLEMRGYKRHQMVAAGI